MNCQIRFELSNPIRVGLTKIGKSGTLSLGFKGVMYEHRRNQINT